MFWGYVMREGEKLGVHPPKKGHLQLELIKSISIVYPSPAVIKSQAKPYSTPLFPL
jgi:hypothetical protein